MTLIITTVSPNVVTMVGDRRLTTQSGQVFNENVSKQGYLVTHDACALYAYTGIAIAGSFNLQHWIGDTLLSLTKLVEVSFYELMTSLARQATHTFNNHPNLRTIPLEKRHTTIIFAGYAVNGDPIFALVSNFEDGNEFPYITPWSDFKATFARADASKPESSMTMLTGNFLSLEFSRWEQLNKLVLQQKSSKTLIQRSRSLLLEASENPNSKNTIGKNQLAAYLNAPQNGAPSFPTTRFISDDGTNSIHALDIVDVRSGIQTFVRDVTIEIDSAASLYPKQRPNDKCSCNSGKKYKKCHGRTR